MTCVKTGGEWWAPKPWASSWLTQLLCLNTVHSQTSTWGSTDLLYYGDPMWTQPKAMDAFDQKKKYFPEDSNGYFLVPPSQEYFAACISMMLLLLTFLLWQGGVAGKHIGSDSSLLQRLGLLAAWRPRKCLIDLTLSSWAPNGFSASGYLGIIVDLLFLLLAWY